MKTLPALLFVALLLLVEGRAKNRRVQVIVRKVA